jgi:ubiquinone/menaquinone biosynthesis C-methylase UbiE
MKATMNSTVPKPVGTREWYDVVGQLADILPGFHMGGQQATERLLEICHLDKESRVLDVGCGARNTACHIAEVCGSQVRGIDISEVMIAKAEERARRLGVDDGVEFRVADVAQMPFEDEPFDVVLLESVPTPLPGDKKEALRETVRGLRPGGRRGANEGTLDPSAPKEYWRSAPSIRGVLRALLTPDTA